MSGQTSDAAERSAHVTRGAAPAERISPCTEIAPGVFRLTCLIRAEAEAAMWRSRFEAVLPELSSLRTLRDAVLDDDAPDAADVPARLRLAAGATLAGASP